MISKTQLLTRRRISHLLMPPSFLLLLCTSHRWKQCLLVTKTWQIRERVEEKPFIKKLELTTVFLFSVAGRWACSFCWHCAHFEVPVTCSRVWTPWYHSHCPRRVFMQQTQMCRRFLLATYVTLPSTLHPLLLSVTSLFCCWRLSTSSCWQPI